eukprot:4754497-Pleurochrysis_carterae.AAC.2
MAIAAAFLAVLADGLLAGLCNQLQSHCKRCGADAKTSAEHICHYTFVLATASLRHRLVPRQLRKTTHKKAQVVLSQAGVTLPTATT